MLKPLRFFPLKGMKAKIVPKNGSSLKPVIFAAVVCGG